MSVRFYEIVENKTNDRTKETRIGAGTVDRAHDEKCGKQDEKGRAENNTDKAVTLRPAPAHAEPHDLGTLQDRDPLCLLTERTV